MPDPFIIKYALLHDPSMAFKSIVYIDHSTIPAFIDELRTWKRAEPTTRNKNNPRTMGPTGIFSSFVYIKHECEQISVRNNETNLPFLSLIPAFCRRSAHRVQP